MSYRELIGFLDNNKLGNLYDINDIESLISNLTDFEIVNNANYNSISYRKFQREKIIKNQKHFHLQKRINETTIQEFENVPDFGKLIEDNRLSKYHSDIPVENFVYYLWGCKIYTITPSVFMKSSPLNTDISITESASNLVSFLDNIKEENPSIFRKIEEDLNKCIPEFKHITLPKTKAENGYWADEVSEGVLYFLALLCIVHQPNPPKLLLLEEPEKGIHPRRIKEVLDFIFQLAEDKDIQVIMTTHSERVLDEFEDIPEAVFIFDKDEEGATQVKNLLRDVIEPSNKLMEENGVPRIKFTDSLGSHWVTELHHDDIDNFSE